VPRARVMRPGSTVKHRRNPWTQKARPRANPDRYRRQPRARVTPERDRATQALQEAPARLRPLAAQRHGLAVPNQGALGFFALQLCLVARLGLRAVSRVLRLRALARGIQKAPGPHTLIHGVTRRALVRIPAARVLPGVPVSFAPLSNGVIWRSASSIALGTGKIGAVLALDAPHHHHPEAAPGFHPVHGVAVSVAASWPGDSNSRSRFVNLLYDHSSGQWEGYATLSTVFGSNFCHGTSQVVLGKASPSRHEGVACPLWESM
jgi:hypothetical protein